MVDCNACNCQRHLLSDQCMARWETGILVIAHTKKDTKALSSSTSGLDPDSLLEKHAHGALVTAFLHCRFHFMALH